MLLILIYILSDDEECKDFCDLPQSYIWGLISRSVKNKSVSKQTNLYIHVAIVKVVDVLL